MGLLDKVKQGAGTALNKAQEGVHQGKAKIDEVQAKRQWEALLTKLGEAVYAERRRGGPSTDVDAALAALDDHESTHGPVDDSEDDDGSTTAASYTTATTSEVATPMAGPDEEPAVSGPAAFSDEPAAITDEPEATLAADNT